MFNTTLSSTKQGCRHCITIFCQCTAAINIIHSSPQELVNTINIDFIKDLDEYIFIYILRAKFVLEQSSNCLVQSWHPSFAQAIPGWSESSPTHYQCCACVCSIFCMCTLVCINLMEPRLYCMAPGGKVCVHVHVCWLIVRLSRIERKKPSYPERKCEAKYCYY